jgi:UDP-2,4-diacetamido-2,4,6-trideoxy-beta-L-altropyranose hydrolase
MQTILIRADASSTIGTGHIMRDLVLAEQYIQSKVIFATQDLKGNLNSKILESGYRVQNLDSNDVHELIEVVKKLSVGMVIIDHYNIDYMFEKTLKEETDVHLMVFDDTYEKHHCDILLNHNISGDKKRYEALVPKNCEVRCGKEYTLLREEFIKAKKESKIITKKIKVFLAIGGSDHSNINIDILNVLKEFENIEVDLVTTNANANLLQLENYVEEKKWINLNINSNCIAKLMRTSDFSIITPSVTLNEVIFMELPFIAIKTADNQEYMYQYLVQNNYLALDIFDIEKLKEKINFLLKQLKGVNR